MTRSSTYTVHFRTDIDAAEDAITASSPEHALAQARAIAADDDRRDALFFEPYTGRFPINEIIVETADGEQAAEWLDQELVVRLAANDLLAALEQAARALNTAKRFHIPCLGRDSHQVAAECERAIAKAKGKPK